MFDLLHEISQTLRCNKLRTILTGIAVSWGIFMLIVLLGMSRGVSNSFNDSFMSTGTDQIMVHGGMTSKPHAGYKEGRRIKLKDPDVDKLMKENPDHIAMVSSTLSNDSAVISTSRDYTSGYTGATPDELAGNNLEMRSGRFINNADLREVRKVAVLPVKVARALLGPDSTAYVGSRVDISGLSFLVIGTYHHDFRENVFIPFTTAKKLNGDSPDINQLKVTIKNVSTQADGDNVEQDIRQTLSTSHDFAPDDRSALWIWNRFTQFLSMSSVMGIMDMMVWIIGLLTMISGIVGVSNIMFVSVRERTHEIGIRRAIGAKPRSILTQIIAESIIITALFGYIGIFLGEVVCGILGYVFRNAEAISNPGVDISIAIQVTVVLIIAGSLAGLFPALKALKIKPVEALRDE